MENWKARMESEAGTGTHKNHHILHSGSPHIRAIDHRNSPHLSAISEPEEDRVRKSSRSPSGSADKSKSARATLRLDAFLGEWLSPDYFDNITPPPGSKMMVASAKADLLRRGESLEAVNHGNGENPNKGTFPGGWKSSNAPPDSPKKQVAHSPLSTMSDLTDAVPKIVRANSHSIVSPGKRRNWLLANRMDGPSNGENRGYNPPTPSYAISPAQPIPQGYVAHARDACVDVDYQWDSMRPPLEWGHGGDYGEEWSSMHKRFRKGLQNMLLWYRNHEASQEADDLDDGTEQLIHTRTQTSDEDDADTVLIIVTHGAGCNALIGGLTNQPVLLDVGMASLTMAIRKTVDYRRISGAESTASSPRRRRRSSIDTGISDDYEVKITASSDHLRPGSQFLGAPLVRARSPSLPVRDKSPYRYERHVGSPTTPRNRNTSPLREHLKADPGRRGSHSFEEAISNGVQSPSTTISSPSGGGLWQKPAMVQTAQSPPEARKIPIPVPKLGTRAPEPETARPKSAVFDSSPESSSPVTSHGKTLAQHGLWGTEPKAVRAELDQTRPKRRWTLGQA